MKLTIVGPTFPYKGGTALHTTALAHRLASAGHQVEIHTWKRQYPSILYPGVQYLDEPEYPVFGVVSRQLTWSSPVGWFRVGSKLGRERDAVILVIVKREQMPALGAIARQARRRGARVVAIAHNVLPHDRRSFDRMMARFVYPFVHSVVVHSDAEADLARSIGCTEIVVRPLPFHFDGEAGPDPADGHRTVRHQLAFFGFVRPHKGLDVLMEAIAISDSKPKLEVRGEFWERPDRYERLIDELGLDDRCVLVPGYGTTQDVIDLLARSDALVVPYRHATGTQVPRVARHLGLPCIVTDVADMAEQIRDGVDGFVVPPGSSRALAAAIDRLYSPGTLESLRTTVRPVDVEEEWKVYVGGVEEALRLVETS